MPSTYWQVNVTIKITAVEHNEASITVRATVFPLLQPKKDFWSPGALNLENDPLAGTEKGQSSGGIQDRPALC